MSRRTLATVVVVGVLLGLDLGAAPERQWTARALSGAIGVYQRTLSPWLALRGVRCRFEPTCSHYALASIEQRGAVVGAVRAAWRLARCGPWTPAGTVDPP